MVRPRDRPIVRSTAFLSQAMRTWGDAVWRLARARTGSPTDADDVYQDVFLRLARDNTDFADEEHLKAWLLRVTINRCRELDRMAWHRHDAPLDEAALQVSDPRADEEFSAAEHAELWRAVERLRPRYREIIHLRYQEGLDSAQIARILQTSTSTVRTRLQRAIRQLKTMVGGD